MQNDRNTIFLCVKYKFIQNHTKSLQFMYFSKFSFFYLLQTFNQLHLLSFMNTSTIWATTSYAFFFRRPSTFFCTSKYIFTLDLYILIMIHQILHVKMMIWFSNVWTLFVHKSEDHACTPNSELIASYFISNKTHWPLNGHSGSKGFNTLPLRRLSPMLRNLSACRYPWKILLDADIRQTIRKDLEDF